MKFAAELAPWDYKHQVLESAHVPNWRVSLWVKFIEAVCQLRPKSLFRLLAHPYQRFRAGMRWYSNIGRRVWPYEVWQRVFCDHRTRFGPKLAEFLKRGWKKRPKAIPRLQVAVRSERRIPASRTYGNEIPPSWQTAFASLPLPRVDENELIAVSDETDQLSRP